MTVKNESRKRWIIIIIIKYTYIVHIIRSSISLYWCCIDLVMLETFWVSAARGIWTKRKVPMRKSSHREFLLDTLFTRPYNWLHTCLAQQSISGKCFSFSSASFGVCVYRFYLQWTFGHYYECCWCIYVDCCRWNGPALLARLYGRIRSSGCGSRTSGNYPISHSIQYHPFSANHLIIIFTGRFGTWIIVCSIGSVVCRWYGASIHSFCQVEENARHEANNRERASVSAFFFFKK